ncbi:DUF3313 domain-containing protein [Novosphingobium beihaiensis]|uniref:DUF3313 domain-containing protein n=1 Tax=Novosphingobium beihaiensis TaxID=2930389 RepID=A0ABT0BLV8_9SPHN|nr:DUF3313 domain-containing protein [Novosphingobium beihaiensis]MCJ2185948.1 DUF3313 domain-containing protein [Novosphingobium beihaiensis]
MRRLPIAAAAALGLAGCAGPQPVVYSDLESASHLRPSADDDNGRIPYAYSVPVNWRRYYRIIIDPVQVYKGPDAQFGKIPPRGQDYLAHYMQERFTKRLSRDFEIVRKPRPSTLRLKLTLTGAHPTPPVIGTFSHFDLAGGPYNAVQGLRGKPGMVSGAVMYAVEIHDARSGRLLYAQVTKQYPGALNIGASFGAMKAAKKGIDKGADELAEQITRNEPGLAQDDRQR